MDERLKNLLGTTAALRGCPCGAKWTDGREAPAYSVTLQLASLGNAERVRGKSVTIHICKRCAKGEDGKLPLRLRGALGDAVYVMAADVAHRVKESDRD